MFFPYSNNALFNGFSNKSVIVESTELYNSPASYSSPENYLTPAEY